MHKKFNTYTNLLRQILSSKLWCFSLITIASFILRIWNYQQIPNKIMTNQGENKNRNHINTGVSFNFNHYMANLLRWGWAKWQNMSLLHHF